MAKFLATGEQMRKAATELDNEAMNYENASKVAMAAADQLASKWEGDAQKVFVAEQQQAKNWYLQMAAIVRQYAAALQKAAKDYQSADTEAARDISRR